MRMIKEQMRCLVAYGLIATIVLTPLLTFAEISNGTSMSSDNFRILDPFHSTFGGISSSSSSAFILTATIGDLAIGSSSVTNFGLRSGFLYFPKVVAPVLNTATAGDAQVALSWTGASAYSGWSIGGYNRCFKTTGAYTCENVGSVTSSTKTGLSNGTTYTFKIEAKDGLGNVIAESNELSAAPVASTPPPSGGGGGGGGGVYTPPSGFGTIIIKGTAYPKSTVHILQNDIVVSQISVDSNSRYEVTLSNVPAGPQFISLYSTDINNRKSITTSFNVTVTANTTTLLSNVLMPPTIDLSATNIPKGSKVKIFGYAEPNAQVDVHVASEETITKAISDANGAYAVNFDTTPLKDEEHTTKSRALFEELVSPFSHTLRFFLGGTGLKTADLNKDGRVNIIDFSILLYWWNTKQATGLSIADINGDGKINIIDFSILLFQWTR